MSSVQDIRVCEECGEEYWYDFDLRGGYTKLSKCYCDRKVDDLIEFLEKKGLLEEFKQFHLEREREARGNPELTLDDLDL